MKQLKKLMGIVLSLMLVFMVAGCGNTAESSTGSQESTTENNEQTRVESNTSDTNEEPASEQTSNTDNAENLTEADSGSDILVVYFSRTGEQYNTLHAYQLAKRANAKRVMYEAVRWGERGARINAISPGIIVTPLAIDEFNGLRGDFYKNMFAKSPEGRPGCADEVAALAELIMGPAGAFITGSDFLIDGGATASYYYGPLNPEAEDGMAEGNQ